MILPIGERVKFYSKAKGNGEGYIRSYLPVVSETLDSKNTFLVSRIEPIPDGALRKFLKGIGIIATKTESKVESPGKLVDGKAWPSKDLRRFFLVRKEDKTGMSGEGIVGEGVEFTDGSCVMRWLTPVGSTCFYPSVKAVEYIHGHSGASFVEYVD